MCVCGGGGGGWYEPLKGKAMHNNRPQEKKLNYTEFKPSMILINEAQHSAKHRLSTGHVQPSPFFKSSRTNQFISRLRYICMNVVSDNILQSREEWINNMLL